MTALRRAGLGLLTVLLLAVSAAAVGYAMRQPAGADIGSELPSPVAHEPDPTGGPEPQRPTQPTQPAVAPTEQPKPAKPRGQRPDKVLLQKGDTGMKVRDLQARLRALAWYFDRPDGVYGVATVEAVRGFQAKRGFPVTGKVDRRTLTRLHNMTGKPTRDELGLPNVPGPLDQRCKVGRVLCIDKSSRTLRWVVDGKVRELVDVRFGSSYTPTREGVFSVYFKSRDHVSSLYDTPMPFAMFFSRGQAVHYSPDFAAVGYSGASHGCVNVRDYEAIKALFDEVEVGDKVVVYWS